MVLPEDEPQESLYKKEEIELKLGKIPELEKRMDRLEVEIIVINKRIKKLQEVKNDNTNTDKGH